MREFKVQVQDVAELTGVFFQVMRFGRRRHFGRRGGGGLGMLLLGMQIFSFFNFLSRSDRFFPVTLGVLALNIITHLRPRGIRVSWPSVQQSCISVQRVWFEGGWQRLLTSPFVHASDYHLYYNMASFMWKAATLERHFGSGYFAYMVAVFTVATGLLYLAIHYVLTEFLDQWSQIQSCAVGFSGVIFALKVVTTHLQPRGVSLIMGFIPVPTRLACWAELVLISVLFPNVSFVGHLAGILVGMAFVSGPLKNLMDMPLALVDTGYGPQDGGEGGGWGGGGGSYTYRAAPTGFRAGTGGGGGGRGGGGRGANQSEREAREEEEELQEAIRMSLQQQQQRRTMPSAPPPQQDEDRDLQEAISRSLQREQGRPVRDPNATPPPYNPACPPLSNPPGDGVGTAGVGGVAPSDQKIPPGRAPGTGGMAQSEQQASEETVRRRHVGNSSEGQTGGGGTDLDAVRAARLKRFERTS